MSSSEDKLRAYLKLVTTNLQETRQRLGGLGGQALLERLLVCFRLQIGKTTHGGHSLLGGRALHVGHGPQRDSRRRLIVGVRQSRPRPCRRD